MAKGQSELKILIPIVLGQHLSLTALFKKVIITARMIYPPSKTQDKFTIISLA